MKSSWQFLKIEGWFFILLLCGMFIDWNVYGYFIFYVPFIYMLFKYGFSKYLDGNFWMLVAFGLSYSVIDVLNGSSINYTISIQPIINFPVLYLMGKSISERNSVDTSILILLIFSISCALLTSLSIYVSVIQEGFSSVTRDVHLIGYVGDETIASATTLYSKILPLSLFISFALLKCNTTYKTLVLLLASLSVYCCLRLQSRSSIYIIAIALMVALFLNEKGKISSKLFWSLIIAAVVYAILHFFGDELVILDRFQDNGVFDNQNSESRSDLAKVIINDLPSHPLGGQRSERYAHNLWLDVSRVSGWMPLLFLLLITKRWMSTIVSLYQNKNIEEYARVFLLVVSMCLFVYFNTEPIIEGAPMLFSFFCVYLGIITETKNKMQ